MRAVFDFGSLYNLYTVFNIIDLSQQALHSFSADKVHKERKYYLAIL